MRNLASVFLPILLLCALVTGEQLIPKGQRAEDLPPAPVKEKADLSVPVSPAQIKADADELATLANGLPGDIVALNRGVLNKGLDKKLQRIEKLAKKLRREISS